MDPQADNRQLRGNRDPAEIRVGKQWQAKIKKFQPDRSLDDIADDPSELIWCPSQCPFADSDLREYVRNAIGTYEVSEEQALGILTTSDFDIEKAYSLMPQLVKTSKNNLMNHDKMHFERSIFKENKLNGIKSFFPENNITALFRYYYNDKTFELKSFISQYLAPENSDEESRNIFKYFIDTCSEDENSDIRRDDFQFDPALIHKILKAIATSDGEGNLEQTTALHELQKEINKHRSQLQNQKQHILKKLTELRGQCRYFEMYHDRANVAKQSVKPKWTRIEVILFAEWLKKQQMQQITHLDFEALAKFLTTKTKEAVTSFFERHRELLITLTRPGVEDEEKYIFLRKYMDDQLNAETSDTKGFTVADQFEVAHRQYLETQGLIDSPTEMYTAINEDVDRKNAQIKLKEEEEEDDEKDDEEDDEEEEEQSSNELIIVEADSDPQPEETIEVKLKTALVLELPNSPIRNISGTSEFEKTGTKVIPIVTANTNSTRPEQMIPSTQTMTTSNPNFTFNATTNSQMPNPVAHTSASSSAVVTDCAVYGGSSGESASPQENDSDHNYHQPSKINKKPSIQWMASNGCLHKIHYVQPPATENSENCENLPQPESARPVGTSSPASKSKDSKDSQRCALSGSALRKTSSLIDSLTRSLPPAGIVPGLDPNIVSLSMSELKADAERFEAELSSGVIAWHAASARVYQATGQPPPPLKRRRLPKKERF